jgi:hypothetical protein
MNDVSEAVRRNGSPGENPGDHPWTPKRPAERCHGGAKLPRAETRAAAETAATSLTGDQPLSVQFRVGRTQRGTADPTNTCSRRMAHPEGWSTVPRGTAADATANGLLSSTLPGDLRSSRRPACTRPEAGAAAASIRRPSQPARQPESCAGPPPERRRSTRGRPFACRRTRKPGGEAVTAQGSRNLR